MLLLIETSDWFAVHRVAFTKGTKIRDTVGNLPSKYPLVPLDGQLAAFTESMVYYKMLKERSVQLGSCCVAVCTFVNDRDVW